MLELVLANLRTRPFRSVISVLGVSLGVILVTLFTGMTVGLSNDMSKRAANWKAEFIFTRPGSGGFSSNNTNVSMKYVDLIKQFEGVETAIPVVKYFTTAPGERWGIMQIDGVNWDEFSAMNEINIVQGRGFQDPLDVVVDEQRLSDKNHKIGDKIKIFDRERTIVGVFSPPSGARVKLPIKSMMEDLETDKVSMILIKIKDGYEPNKIADAILAKYEGNKIEFTRDLVIDAEDRIPGLKTLLNLLVFLGAFVSTIFVLLSMYTTITERRKEIGILKSMGASKQFIIKVIEGEAFMIGVLGVIFGLGGSFGAAALIGLVYGLPFEFRIGWIVTAVLIAIGGSTIGALYPAWQASKIDPVEVMVNE